MKLKLLKYLKKNYPLKTKVFISNKFLDNIEIDENFILVVPKNINKLILNQIKKKFKKQISKIVFKPSGEPNSNMINHFLNQDFNAKSILVIGGGSAIDFAKAISIISPKKKIQFHEFGSKIKNSIPIDCIPTTCGSGSDVSPYSVINNSKTKRKFTINDKKLVPRNTFIFPNLLKKISKKTIFSSLYDAFSHCLEVFLNKNQKPQIKRLAFNGIKMGIRLLNNRIDSKYYKDYMILALIGGMCISESRTSIIHTLSVGVSKYYNLPHGLLNLYLTNLGINFNSPYVQKDIIRIETIINNKSFMIWLKQLEQKNRKFYNIDKKNIDLIDVINRIKQDKGLKKVCYQKINNKNLSYLIKKLDEKNKNFF